MKALLLGVLLFLSQTPAGLSAQEPGKVAADPSLVDVPDNFSLPRVLLIGDSISMAYAIPTRRLLQGRATIHNTPMIGCRTTDKGVVCTTDKGLANLDVAPGKGKWDIIHFNWGLHDLWVQDDGSYLVPLDRYEKNLRELVKRLTGTGATLIWATTTPVPDADVAILHRKSSDAIAYNGVARKIMDRNGIAIDDLYAFALPRLAKIQKPADVHFTDEGSEELARQVAASILAALKTRARD